MVKFILGTEVRSIIDNFMHRHACFTLSIITTGAKKPEYFQAQYFKYAGHILKAKLTLDFR
jgi:hypothetical protein